MGPENTLPPKLIWSARKVINLVVALLETTAPALTNKPDAPAASNSTVSVLAVVVPEATTTLPEAIAVIFAKAVTSALMVKSELLPLACKRMLPDALDKVLLTLKAAVVPPALVTVMSPLAAAELVPPE